MQQHQHQSEDTNKTIIDYSIAVLKQEYPNSLTIKELNTALLAKYKRAKILLKTSTILSTKLNAFYRKCQTLPTQVTSEGELPERFRVCPIVRDATPDGKRLVYKYTVSLQDVPERELQALPSIPIMSPKSSPEDDEDEHSSTDENDARSSPDSPYQLRRVIKKTPHAFTTQPAKRRLSAESNSSNKKPRVAVPSPTSEANLYYGPAAAAAAVAPLLAAERADWFSGVDEFDLTNEQISMADLDAMF
ncbi:hypothetical protein D0Z00_003359 [Geotrichum galactomycetum]|uniref:Uncharacterized protein n=1 Tax=Geotrichum galactomycetum TaxID=27317 RepID=A0ACB6V1J7_9ASCO|nr:hypothetical protein D0Z00_003359 [Geotrichum candidum]